MAFRKLERSRARGSYLSQSDLRAHFGLGQQMRIESLEISWPSGLRESFKGIEADRFYVVEEAKNVLRLQVVNP